MLYRNSLYGANGNTGAAFDAAVVNLSFAINHGNSLYRTGSNTGFATYACIFVDLCCHKKFPPSQEKLFHQILTAIDRIIQYAEMACNI